MTRILLTGGTGLIGGAVLVQAARTLPDARFTALVRAVDEAEGRKRLTLRLARLAPMAEAQAIAARTEILPGDLFTLPAHAVRGSLAECTHILHLAADTSYWSKEANWKVNYEGTMALARAARTMPLLERFLHVSTATVCGRNAPKLILEDSYPDAAADHIVHYTYAKAETELALRRDFAELPVVICRPSIVAGHSVLGAAPTASIFWFVRAADAMGLVTTDPLGGIDIIPFDWTADALLSLLTKPALAHDLYHVSAGAGSRTWWPELHAAFAAHAGEALPPLRRLDPADGATLRARFKAVFGTGDSRLALMQRACRKYYEFCALDATFDNSRLLAEGIAPPPPLPAYLATCLDNPKGRSILDSFLDDLDMFDPDAATPAPAEAPVLAA